MRAHHLAKSRIIILRLDLFVNSLLLAARSFSPELIRTSRGL